MMSYKEAPGETVSSVEIRFVSREVQEKSLYRQPFISILDYGDILYMHANSFENAGLLYHAALRFITDSAFRTPRNSLYERVGWPSLGSRRLEHWYGFLSKAIACDMPLYLYSPKPF